MDTYLSNGFCISKFGPGAYEIIDPSGNKRSVRRSDGGVTNYFKTKAAARKAIMQIAKKSNPSRKPPIGKFIKADAVKFNRNGTVTLKVRDSVVKRNPSLKRNVEKGFYNATGFHPLRSSFDYDPDRASDYYGDYGSGVKRKAPKRKAATKKRKATAKRRK